MILTQSAWFLLPAHLLMYHCVYTSGRIIWEVGGSSGGSIESVCAEHHTHLASHGSVAARELRGCRGRLTWS